MWYASYLIKTALAADLYKSAAGPSRRSTGVAVAKPVVPAASIAAQPKPQQQQIAVPGIAELSQQAVGRQLERGAVGTKPVTRYEIDKPVPRQEQVVVPQGTVPLWARGLSWAINNPKKTLAGLGLIGTGLTYALWPRGNADGQAGGQAVQPTTTGAEDIHRGMSAIGQRGSGGL